jgi:ATP-dependent Clp protease ATP-binding subunit ClpB
LPLFEEQKSKRITIMNLNNFTLKAQESIQKAQEIAVGSQHPQIENAHILKGLLISDDNVVPFLIKKLDVNLTHLQSELDKLLNGYAKVSGGQIYLSPNATTALQKSLTFLKDFNDELKDYYSKPFTFLNMDLVK